MPEIPRSRQSIPVLVAMCAVAAAWSPRDASAAVYDLGASADTWLRESSPLDVRGSDQELRAQTAKLDSERPLLAFDLGAIPVDAYVLGAQLTLQATKADTPSKIDVYPVKAAWTEPTANWLLDGSAYDASRSRAQLDAAAAGSVSVDVTALAQAWVDGSLPNNGVMLIPATTDVQTRFASREWGTASEQPRLVVTTGAAAAGTADLGVSVTASDAAPAESDVVTWTVVVRNAGPNLATAVEVTAALPPGLTRVGDAADQGSWTPATGIWTVGAIGAGDSVTLTVDASVDAGGAGARLRVPAAVTGLDQTDPAPADDAAEAIATVRGGVFRVTSGLIFGSGTGFPVSIGFRPDLVIVKDEGNRSSVLSTFSMQGLAKLPDTPASAAVGMIASMDSAGFTLGSDVNVNESGRTYHWIAMRAAAGQLVTGEYVGDGTDDRDVGGVGFQPAWVVVSGEGATLTVQRFASQTGDSTLAFDASNAAPDRIQLLQPDGFQVGTDPTVNAAGVTYHFAAWNTVASEGAQGSYLGDNIDNRQILDPGFAPGFVSVVRNADRATLRPASATGDATLFFSNVASATDRIQALLPAGFEVGKNNDVNGNAQLYHWIALADSTGPRSDLVVTASVDDPAPDPNAAVTLTFDVRNDGPDDATGIVLTDVLPADLAFQSAVPSAGSYSSAAHQWTLGPLAAGNNATLDLVVAVADEPAADTLSASAAVTAVDQLDAGPGDEADSVSVVVNGNDLQVALTVDDPVPGEGDTVLFHATVLNAGAGTSSAIAAGAALPPGLTAVADSVTQGTYTAATGAWSVGALAPGGSAELLLGASVDPGTAGSTLTALAWADSSSRPDPVAANDADSASVAVMATDLETVVTADDTTPDVGAPVTFAVTVRNLGPDATSTLEVTDLLPGGLTWQADSVSQGGYTAGTGVWSVGAVAAGDSASLFLTATVDSGTAGTSIVNAAAVTASIPADGNPANDADSVRIDVPGADLAAAITVDDPAPAEADSVGFLVTLRNLGPADATGIAVTDSLPAGLTWVADTPSQGAYDPPSGAWNVGAVAAGDSATLFVRATVDSGTGGATLVNRVTGLRADQGDPAPGNETDSVTVTVRSADVRLTNVVSDPAPAPGDTVVYSLALANFGPDAADSVGVSEPLPAGVTYVGHTAGGATSYDPVSGIWDVGTVAAASGVALQVTASVDPGTAGRTITNAAAVVAMDPTDPDLSTNSASAVLTVRAADLDLAAAVSDSLPNEGDAVTLSFRVLDAGPDSASAATVSAPLPAGLTWQSDTPSQGTWTAGIWSVGALAAGDSASLDLVGTVDPGTGGQVLADTAAVAASLPGDPTAANDSAAVSLRVQSADLAVAKTANNATPDAGSTVTYTVTLRNLGPDPATGVALADTLPAGITFQSSTASVGSYASATGIWTVGTVAAADSATLMITATADSASGGQTLTNVASVLAADTADPDGSNDADSVSVDVLPAIPASSDLALAMTLDAPAPDEGDPVAFAVTLTNAGPGSASGVVVTDLLPAGLAHAGHVASRGTYDPVTGLWTVGGVALADTLTLDLSATVAAGTAGATLTNTATITASDQGDPAPANNTTLQAAVVRAADVALGVTADTTRASEGDTVVVTVTALNQGPDSTAALEVTASLPAGLAYAGDVASDGVFDSGTGIWTVGAIPAAAAATLDLTAVVGPGTAGGTLTTTAAVTGSARGDPDAANDADSLALPVDAVDLVVAKSVDVAAPDEGDAVTFTVTVRNAGPDGATGVQVGDPLPAGLTWQSDAPDQGTYAAGTGLWDVGTIVAGDSATLALTATVGSGTAGQAITNVAGVAAVAQTDVAPGNDADSAAVTVRAADLRVTQAVDVPNPYEGGTVRFTVAVANLGPDSTGAVSVLDPLPAGLTWQADSASQGAYASGSGLWTVGTLAAGDSATLSLAATVDYGTAGQTLWNAASVAGSSTGDPVAANDADSVSVTVGQGVLLLASQPASAAVLPGEANAHLFTLSIANSQPASVTLSQLAFRNAGSGPGSQAQLDAELGSLTLWRDDGDFSFDPRTDTPLGTATASGGTATFGGLSFAVPSGAITTLFVGTDVGLAARDGDLLDVDLPGPGSVSFQGAVTFQNAWPLAPSPSYPVDGMAMAQITATAPGGTVLTGSADALVLDAVLPANGYAGDVLQQLRIGNLGTAAALLDLTAVELWTDGGDGSFDGGLGDDTYRGAGVWTGSDWSWTGLTAAIPAAGLRVFVSADVSPLATPDATIRMEIPSPAGVSVASANDGPLDGPVAPAPVATIQQAPSVVTAGNAVQAGATLLPAASPREVLRFDLVNTAAVAETLSAVTFANATSGPGTRAELDAEWSALSVTVLSRGIGIGGSARAAAPSFSGGHATFSGLGARIAAGDTATVVLSGAASRTARDGDRLDVAVTGAGSLAFTDGSVQVTGPFPLAPPAGFPVDGMSAAQITVPARVPATVLTGSVRNVSLLVDIPANGYEADVLRYVNLRNNGDAVAGTDIAAMELWHDFDGDGVPEPKGDDLPGRLGPMVFTGNRWEITGLAHPVAPGGERLFVTTDVSDLAAFGHRIQLAFPTSPDFGLGVESGNDGPIDAEAPADTAQVAQSISTRDRVTFGTTLLAPGTVAPGEAAVPLLRIRITNDYTVPKTLTALDVTNRTAGAGTLPQLDSEVGQLHLRADSLGGAELAKTVFTGGTAAFAGFSLALAAGETRDVVVSADVSATLAADGDVLDAEIAGEGDVTFGDLTTIVATWPLTSEAAWTVDGMLAAQVTNHGAPPATLGPAEGPALALDLTIPSNGYAADILRGVSVVNDSTATPSDIASMHLWRDGGDGTFDAGAGDDADLGPMTPVGSEWVSPALSAAVPPGGVRCFVSIASVSSPVDATIRLAVPVGGLTMESGDDGPIDARVVNPDVITLSSSALLADLEIVPDKSTVGSMVTAVMTVRNVGDSTVVGIGPSALTPDVPSVLTLVGGPTPASLDLAPDSTGTFSWTWSTNQAGTVRLTGRASGTEVGSGLTRQTPDATSGAHQVFVPAQDLELFPVESMPFSVSQGQTGVVPLSLTLTNLAPAGGSSVRVTRLSFRLEDGTGAGIVPADLLKRAVVNEGTNVYADKSSTLETTGDLVDLPLDLAQALVPPDSGQVTLSLSLDVSDSTTVPEFRLSIADASWIDAEDATNGAPVTISLSPSASYPIESGLARVVTEATELDVASTGGQPLTAGRGQDDVPLLDLVLASPDPDSLAADVRVSRFDVVLTDSAGAAVAQPSLYLDGIRVEAAFQPLLDRAVTAADDSTIALALSPLLSVPANTPVPIRVLADIHPSSPTGPVRLRLADPASFDARDANSGALIPAVYQSDPVEGPVATIVAPADTVLAAGRPLLPATLPVGTADQPALRLVLRHPGGPDTGPVTLESLSLACLDQADQPLPPATYVDRARALRGGTEIGLESNPPSTGGTFTLSLGGTTLAPGQVDSVEIRLDVQVTAPADLFRLGLAASGILAFDTSLGLPVAVAAETGTAFPFTSGLTQLESPARTLAVGFSDEMPPVLASDGATVAFAGLGLGNAAPPTAGTITVSGLTVRAADRDLAAIDLGAAVARVEAWRDGTLWADSGDLPPDATTATLTAAQPLVLPPGPPTGLELRAVLRSGAAVPALRLGLDAGDVAVVQPPSQLLQVAVQAANGLTFPFWTETGNFSGVSLEESWSNFPNPFAGGRERTTFAFYLPQSGRVSLKLWTARGKAVRTLLDGAAMPAGLHQDQTWDGRNGRGETVTNGVYLAEIAVVFDDGSTARALRKVAVVR